MMQNKLTVQLCHQIVTRDASPEAGASVNCRKNVQHTFEIIFQLAESQGGLAGLDEAFSTCKPLAPGQQRDLAYWIQVRFSSDWAWAIT